MTWVSAPLCVVCFRKLKGPQQEPVRVKESELSPGERWQPCALCEGPCDAVPGIYYRLYLEKPPDIPPPQAA
jgi:hypothetical protein